jgi:methylmalonyl-CoA/ethylmalonyl-CoA epimerase
MLIDHLGVVVRNLEKATKHWEKVFGYSQLTEPVINSRQKVRVVFLSKDNSLLIKLVEPIDKSSSVYEMARKGGGLHHLCFKVDDLNKKIVELKGLGLRVLAGPEPGEAFECEEIAFLYGKQGLNVELIDTDKLAGRL